MEVPLVAVEAPHHAEVATVPGVNRIDHFVIPVNDLWRCHEFYRDILGANAVSSHLADAG
jgi:catechol-2,3-dioxygenase